MSNASVQQGLANRVGTQGTQIAKSQIFPRLRDEILQGSCCPLAMAWRTRAIGPIDAVQALAFGTLDPEGNRGNTDTELTSDGTKRQASSNGSYHVSATLLLMLCLLIELPH
jgi:hypothetical protein